MTTESIGTTIDPLKYYDYKEVEVLLGICTKTIRARVKEGRLAMSKPARNRCLFKGQSIIDFLNE